MFACNCFLQCDKRDWNFGADDDDDEYQKDDYQKYKSDYQKDKSDYDDGKYQKDKYKNDKPTLRPSYRPGPNYDMGMNAYSRKGPSPYGSNGLPTYRPTYSAAYRIQANSNSYSNIEYIDYTNPDPNAYVSIYPRQYGGYGN